MSRCEGFPMFRGLSVSPSSGCAHDLVEPKLTKPPAHSGVSP
jgi:hypothetical protein